MPLDNTTIRIELLGLTPKEAEEIQLVLQKSEHVASVRNTFGTHEGIPDRALSIQASIASSHLIVELLSLAVPAGTFVNTNPFLKTVQDELAKDLMKWLRSKYTGQSSVEVEARILGPDGRPVHSVTRRR